VVARAVVGIPTVLCLWISEIIASVPGRCAVTVLELLTGTMLTGYGSISQAILAVPCRRHWTSYYYPNLGFPTGLKMETESLQRAFRAGSEDEERFSRLQSLGEDGPWTATCVWSGCTA
jgi:hypothetical protein